PRWRCSGARRGLRGGRSSGWPIQTPCTASPTTSAAGNRGPGRGWAGWETTGATCVDEKSTVEPPQRVGWSGGMLGSPQHLQQADLYRERLLDQRLASLQPAAWGLCSVELDPAALAAEQVRVARLVGILPDGLTMACEGGDPECPPARPLQGHFPPTQ